MVHHAFTAFPNFSNLGRGPTTDGDRFFRWLRQHGISCSRKEGNQFHRLLCFALRRGREKGVSDVIKRRAYPSMVEKPMAMRRSGGAERGFDSRPGYCTVAQEVLEYRRETSRVEHGLVELWEPNKIISNTSAERLIQHVRFNWASFLRDSGEKVWVKLDRSQVPTLGARSVERKATYEHRAGSVKRETFSRMNKINCRIHGRNRGQTGMAIETYCRGQPSEKSPLWG